jgi:hypothetical protein
MANLLDRIPAPIRSLWNAEIEFRRGIWASVLHRGEPNPHYGEARRHFNEALQTHPHVPEDKGTWESAEHVAATVEQDRIDESGKNKTDRGLAPRV